DFVPRLIARGGTLAVLNDEAHHTHDEESEWNQCIRGLHSDVPGGLAGQFDFTATPRHTKGQLFSWTVYDYPLKQAILDNIVKRPLKGIAKGITEQKSEIASTRYQDYLAAGVERWKEYRDQLAPLNRKPVLFIMMNDTAEADDVGDWLQKKYPAEFGGGRTKKREPTRPPLFCWLGPVARWQLEHLNKVKLIDGQYHVKHEERRNQMINANGRAKQR